MNRLKKAAILIELARAIRDQGSWCGETHLQKAAYLLQELYSVPTEFDFVLYKHGPFSFDLRDELTSLRADGLFVLEPQPAPYGPKLAPTANAETLIRQFPNTLKRYERNIASVAETVGDRGVSELEKVASAIYISHRELPGRSTSRRAKRLHEIKPHISDSDALAAVVSADELIRISKLSPTSAGSE